MAFPSLHAERLHEALPNSTLTLVPGQGHMLQHLAPDVVLRAALGERRAPPMQAQPSMQDRWPFNSPEAVAA